MHCVDGVAKHKTPRERMSQFEQKSREHVNNSEQDSAEREPPSKKRSQDQAFPDVEKIRVHEALGCLVVLVHLLPRAVS